MRAVATTEQIPTWYRKLRVVQLAQAIVESANLQGSVGNLKPTVEEEMWLMTMMWASGQEKPEPGTKFLISANNRYVVVVAGHETGPGSQEFLGGLTREVHAWLGTNNSSKLTLEYLKDQSVPIGPVELEENEVKFYRVTAQSLNVRREPSISSTVIGSLEKNQVIPDAPKQADQDQRTWMKVTLPKNVESCNKTLH